ncbi:hypothetical protein [Luteibacter sp. 22Crub2.1]|uniref:hypothetical protein n=1 Tax=Luteibacter sp. 22Crub2.1 TaxID=1283288 RepID=UPI0009A57E97|nr:hypothetical protein [Luteibacter sp. 22Crub2.1]SKB42888.1 hypothetical protein SAMN05660880_01017 [Luteibacter sp. 22Crub2.1]
MTSFRSFRSFRAAAAIALLLASSITVAGTVKYIEVTSPEAMLAAKENLVSTFKYHLRGAQRYAAAHGPATTTERAYTGFRMEWAKATAAQVKYRWIDSTGRPRTTLYHGLSGRVAAAALPRETGVPVPSFDMPDWAQYYSDVNPNVYARIPDGEHSILEESMAGDSTARLGRGYDAEMRALRTIERDILAGNIPRGGVIAAWVSQPPCQACRKAFQIFSDAYHVNIHVIHLPAYEPGATGDVRLFQMTKNRMLRDFHLRVENERAGKIADNFCPRM